MWRYLAFPRRNHLSYKGDAPMEHAITGTRVSESESRHKLAEPSASLAAISRKWLAEISPADFAHCHEYLAAVRLARHMSKIDVCRASQVDSDPATGVSLPTVSKIESGSYGEPGFRTMVRLARGYGVPVANFEQFFK
jgi:hypothetical protein